MRILIATDAWSPQINGVVVALSNTIARLRIEVEVVSSEGMRTIPTPTYPEIPLAIMPGREVAKRLEAAAAVVVATATMRETLTAHGFERLFECPLGVDLELFRPSDERFADLPRPVFTYVGRVAAEKNLPEFLRLDLPGTKLVVGDGPARAKLQQRFPEARFVGYKTGAELARYYQRSDAFVFPSRTETFGLVMLEAMACGVPVAALPVRGPLDVVKDPSTGVLDMDLRRAALAALELDRAQGRAYAEQFPWGRSCERFLSHFVPTRAVSSSSGPRVIGSAAD